MDDILYSLFIIVVTVIIFFANGKKAKEDDTHAPMPNAQSGDDDRQQSDEWFNRNDYPTHKPQEPSLADIIEALTGAKPSTPAPRTVTPPPVPKPTYETMAAPKPTSSTKSPFIQAAETEGISVTNVKTSFDNENPYQDENDNSNDFSAQNFDWRKAIIAHEILKRKF